MDEHSYDDIINLPNPTSKNHPRMSLHDRAAQFAPFAALTVHDPAGGAYLTHSGIVKKIDEFERKLIMQDETVIPTEQISVIQGEMFKGLYE